MHLNSYIKTCFIFLEKMPIELLCNFIQLYFYLININRIYKRCFLELRRQTVLIFKISNDFILR